MQNLIIFLIRYSTVFVFVGLELISYVLVINYNSEQKKIFSYSTNVITGSLVHKMQDASNYLRLDELADSLASENALLRAKLFAFEEYCKEVSTPLLPLDFELIPARIANNSISSRHNSFSINKGSKDGVLPEMGIVNSQGVIGIVRHVSEHFASAISILNPNMRISAKIKHNNFFGILRWKGMNLKEFELIDIPKYAPVNLGDTIITSSYSSVFPEGIPLGVIDKYSLPPGGNTFDITVKLFVQPENMKFAYVLKNANLHEIKSLDFSGN